MPLDGAFLHELTNEIEKSALGARVDRIMQPAHDELVFLLRWRGDSGRLLLSASASGPRLHFTRHVSENPKNAPMFCMLLRKHFSGAKLVAVRQIGLDRVVHLDFECRNELGDLVLMSIVIEMMGRHSNIIALDPDGRVLDAIKRVSMETSSVRQVLPGMRYLPPPAQNKLSMLEASGAELVARIKNGRNIVLSQALVEALQGCSPLLCREIAHYALRGGDNAMADLSDEQWQRLAFYLQRLAETLSTHTGTPTLIQEPDGRPMDFSFLPILQYGAARVNRVCESYSLLLDSFYARRNQLERMHQRSGDLLRLLANADQRIARKLAAQADELRECEHRETLRIYGDLITANLHKIQPGESILQTENYYDASRAEIQIPLDIRLSPAKNAQRYYAQYRKAATAEKKLRELMHQGEEERRYIESVFDALTRATTEAELLAIRQEVANSGYAKPVVQKKRPQKADKLPPLEFCSSDGYTIFVGRNNLQNDRLTLKDSRGNDLWLHTQKIPGSHTVIVANSKENIPERTIEQACILAATHSKARESAKVPVDFTQIRHVKKPAGAKPGMVIYDNFRTVFVDPDEALAQRLLVKK